MSEQLAQMATQLKRNAMHFSESLARDQAVVDEAQEKLEGNYDVMKKERVRLRDHRGKSGSTTCLVLMSMLVDTQWPPVIPRCTSFLPARGPSKNRCRLGLCTCDSHMMGVVRPVIVGVSHG
ncbi:hypothetical protein PLICRDRAFT_464542 [Plicaturopsis crispa FD-325 SS-3]|nr:hypothetical protein PLICRDRAFT_464542 [Plicaturopsis crispa FD-325 SS-3]